MAGFSSGSISPDNVDLDSSQTLQNKTLDASNDFSGDIIDPSRSDVKQGTQAELEAYASGATNGQMCFATDTKQMYQVLDGALAAVGGGSGGLDTFFTDTFEVAGVSDYTSGNDAIFDNGGSLAGALADETVNNISGDQSLKYTQAAGSLNDFIKSPLIPIGKKQQGNTVGLELFYTYSGNSDDIKIVGYDDTGSEVMTLSSNLIKASSKAQRLSVQFPVPSGSANLAWGIQVVVENDGAVLVVDDVQISMNPYVSKDLLDTSTLAFTGASDRGSVDTSTVKFDTLDYQEGSGFTIVDNASNGTQVIINKEGTLDVDYTLKVSRYVSTSIVHNGTNVTFDLIANSGAVTDDSGRSAHCTLKVNVGDIIKINSNVDPYVNSANQFRLVLTAATEHIVAYNSRNAENLVVEGLSNIGGGLTANSTDITFTGVKDTGFGGNNWSGTVFTAPEDGIYDFSGSVLFTSAVNLGIIAYKNSSSFRRVGNTFAEQVGIINLTVNLEKGDTISFRVDSAGSTLLASTLAHYLNITKIGVGDLLGVPVPRTAYIKDVKSSGTNGGTSTALTVTTRELNSLKGDVEFISLSSNQITLQPGKYEITASAPAYDLNRHQIFLYDSTSLSYIINGSSEFADTGGTGQTRSMLDGVLDITTTTTYEIRHWTEGTSTGGNGLGVASDIHASNPQTEEVYTQVKITRIS